MIKIYKGIDWEYKQVKIDVTTVKDKERERNDKYGASQNRYNPLM